MADSTKPDLKQGTAPRRRAIDPAWSEDLMERVLTPENLRKAWHQVKANHGAPGVDGMIIEDFPACAREHWASIRQTRRDETYQPAPVRRTEIPKRHGQGKRLLGIPTVVDRVSRDSLANREETFGPIAPLIVVSDLDDAIEVANSCTLGLCASVYTSDMNAAFRCAERLECGVVNVNESAAYWDGRTPFGGWSGKGSGVGRVGGMESIRFMTQIKSVVLDINSPHGD